MMLLAALVGAAAGFGATTMMQRAGMLSERSGVAVMLIAVALFFPVFAAAEGDLLAFALHLLIFAGFATLAIRGYARGMFLLAGGLIAHGLFDIMAGLIAAPGPAWWPLFCASFDIVAGVLILQLIQSGKVAR